MKIAGLLSGLAMAICATTASMAASESSSAPTRGRADAREPFATEGARGAMAQAALALHNAERSRLRLPHLSWNRNLEREASEWAQELAQRGRLQHADHDRRGGAGENLWMGTAGHWGVDGMVGMFIEERRHYRHDRFPEISHTGNWADVGHYSQIVWRDTREVGCAMASARGNDVFVCRYYPAGNVWGQRAY